MVFNRLYKSSKYDESPNIGRYRRAPFLETRVFNYQPNLNWMNDYERPMNYDDLNYFYWTSHEL